MPGDAGSGAAPMLDILGHDGAARFTTLPVGGRELALPILVSTRAAHPAAIILARSRPEGDTLWVFDRGSIFRSVDPDGEPDLVIQTDVPYTPSSGDELLEAGDAENRDRHRDGEAFVAVAPRGPVPDDAPVVLLASAAALLRNPYTFAGHVTAVRDRAGAHRALWAPACARPENVALLLYCGVDIVDDIDVRIEATRGKYLTPEGDVPRDALTELPCSCDACRAAAADPASVDLEAHNVNALALELARARTAMRAGRLRELVEQRVRARPELAASLRRLDLEAYPFFETRAPLLRTGRLFATSKESIQRPEVERFRRRLADRYRKPASTRIMLVLPCSARKPYSESRTHRTLDMALQRVGNRPTIHEVIMTSPLGLVPRELERAYPAAHYDLPVTGHWDEDEKEMVRGVIRGMLTGNRYDHVVVHLDDVEAAIVAPVLDEVGIPFTVTGGDNPLGGRNLDAMRETLNKLTFGTLGVSWQDRNLDDVHAVATWQFGIEGANALTKDAHARGKPPMMKLYSKDSEQLATTVPDRGLLAITLGAGQRLLEAGVLRVEIENFRPKGTVFAVGVKDADPDIRPEDEVVLHHNGEFKGVGRAIMHGVEMTEAKKGGAVAMRHYVK